MEGASSYGWAFFFNVRRRSSTYLSTHPRIASSSQTPFCAKVAMYPAYQVPSPHSLLESLPPSRQSKVVMQRRYRKREGACIDTLRSVIKELTGKEPQTRKEILRKGCVFIVIPVWWLIDLHGKRSTCSQLYRRSGGRETWRLMLFLQPRVKSMVPLTWVESFIYNTIEVLIAF